MSFSQVFIKALSRRELSSPVLRLCSRRAVTIISMTLTAMMMKIKTTKATLRETKPRMDNTPQELPIYALIKNPKMMSFGNRSKKQVATLKFTVIWA